MELKAAVNKRTQNQRGALADHCECPCSDCVLVFLASTHICYLCILEINQRGSPLEVCFFVFAVYSSLGINSKNMFIIFSLRPPCFSICVLRRGQFSTKKQTALHPSEM